MLLQAPGLKVVAPSTPADVVGLMASANAGSGQLSVRLTPSWAFGVEYGRAAVMTSNASASENSAVAVMLAQASVSSG